MDPVLRQHVRNIFILRYGYYRKEKKSRYNNFIYNQRNKVKNMLCIIKILLAEHMISNVMALASRELVFSATTYNLHRIINQLIILRYVL